MRKMINNLFIMSQVITLFYLGHGNALVSLYWEG